MMICLTKPSGLSQYRDFADEVVFTELGTWTGYRVVNDGQKVWGESFDRPRKIVEGGLIRIGNLIETERIFKEQK